MSFLGIICAIGVFIYGITEKPRNNKAAKKYKEEQTKRLGEDPWDMLLKKLESKK